MQFHSATVLPSWTTAAWNCSSLSLDSSQGRGRDRRFEVVCRKVGLSQKLRHKRAITEYSTRIVQIAHIAIVGRLFRKWT